MQPKSRYDVQIEGSVAHYTVTPAPIPFNVGRTIWLLLLGLLGLYIGMSSSARFMIIALPAAVAALYLLDQRDRKARKIKRFSVTPTEIIAASSRILAENMPMFYLRNSVSAEQQNVDPAYMAMASAMVTRQDAGIGQLGAINLAAAATRAKKNRKLAAISWQLDVEASGVVTTLAYGMEPAVARGLVLDVERRATNLMRP